MMTLGKKKN